MLKIAQRTDFHVHSKRSDNSSKSYKKLGRTESDFQSLYFYGFENLLKYNKITYISISVLNIGSKYGKIFLHIYKNASLHMNKGITALTWHYIN